MADLRFEDKNNQKKVSSVFASGLITTYAALDEALFTLPPASLVTRVYAHVDTIGGGDATDSIDVKVGNTTVADEIVIGTLGTKTGNVTPTYFPTGGNVSVVAGADAPAEEVIKIVVEYIETELTSGEYTD